jgi:protein subunit release factor B
LLDIRIDPRNPRLSSCSDLAREVPMLQVTPTIEIPDSELAESFVRASGPGGQNVNKVARA